MDAYLNEILEWRESMDVNLRAPYSWLSLAGLFWLEEGVNVIGSAQDCKVLLPERFPKSIGEVHRNGEQISIKSLDGHTIKVNEKGPLLGSHQLSADITGKPDYVFIDDLRLMLIERDGNPAIRLWDPQHENLLNFPGRIWFDCDSSWRIPAKIEYFDQPKEVLIDDIVGFQHKTNMDARLHFTIADQDYSLEAEKLESGAFYVIFKDNSAEVDTYPSGRYMVTEEAINDEVIIDFNRAYNPPCAFTVHATCPLPRPENILPVRIPAGELFLPLA